MTEKLLDLTRPKTERLATLPDGKVYPVRSSDDMSMADIHKIIRGFRKSRELMAADDVTESDIERMQSILNDLACALIDAPEDVVSQIPVSKIEVLVQDFWQTWQATPDGQVETK